MSSSYSEICGNVWQEQYAKMHKSYIQNKYPSNIIISVPIVSGLADIILGYVTGFLISILTDRPYFILNSDKMKDDERGVQTRKGHASDHFYCVDDLIQNFKNQNIGVIILYISAKKEDQEYYKNLYGDSLLLPLNIPSSVETVHDSFNGPQRNDARAIRESARDLYLLSLTDIQIISAKSGFGVLGSMLKLKNEHVIYRIEPGQKRLCSATPGGDNLEYVSSQWSAKQRAPINSIFNLYLLQSGEYYSDVNHKESSTDLFIYRLLTNDLY
eukprot:gene4344-8649_t